MGNQIIKNKHDGKVFADYVDIHLKTIPIKLFPLAQKIEVLDSEETLKYKNISIWI